MDGPRGRWYFSTIVRHGVPTVAFHRTKYGRELLVDAAFLHALPNFERGDRPYALAFHDVLLVTRGRGTASLDDRTVPLAPGTVLLTRPGEVRRLAVPGLDGACLFFTDDFLGETFADPHLVERFACFRRDRPSPVLGLAPAERQLFLRRFRDMEREVADLRSDASEVLRAGVHELLVLLNRWYVARHGPVPPRVDGAVERFRALVDRDFATEQRVARYARAVGLTPGHLGALCRAGLGKSAGAVIRERVVHEAKRLLRYTDLTAAEVGDRLGFTDPAYFARYFRRETGTPPSVYRSRVRA